jgi:ParB family chromosome partitioning protein
MPQHRGLGKGLDALIPTEGFGAEPAAGSGVAQASIDQIAPNPHQPRARFDSPELEELAASIREHGIIQPLIVTRTDDGSGYVLIAGERRLQAAKLAGLMSVPVIVRQVSDEQRLELALIENLQRADLNPLEEAHAYQALVDRFKLSHDEIAARVGKSRVAVTNTLRLLKLPKTVVEALIEDRITEGHARALLALNSNKAMDAALKTILSQDLTVRQTEELVRKLGGEKSRSKPKDEPSADVAALEERLRASLGTRVTVRAGKKGTGAVVIHYYSTEELDAILERLTK